VISPIQHYIEQALLDNRKLSCVSIQVGKTPKPFMIGDEDAVLLPPTEPDYSLAMSGAE